MNDRQRQLIELGELHTAWVLRHEHTWRPGDARPGPKGTDYPLHAVDRSAGSDAEREFAVAADRLFIGR